VTWLFPNRKGGPVTPRGYRIAINELAYRHRARDATGALFRVHPHGFRHTVGTRMINNDVPQRVVQQFLGHESPSMTARYAHIHDATMKRKLAEYRGKVIDITGKVVEEMVPQSPATLSGSSGTSWPRLCHMAFAGYLSSKVSAHTRTHV